jgi:hypothetical protein
VIRFTCSNCGRAYHVPEALARLSLLCKGCAQRLVVPEASTDPEPPEMPFEHSLDPPGMVGTVDLFPDTDMVRKPAGPREIPDPQDSVDLFPKPDLEPASAGVPPLKRQPVPALAAPVRVDRGRALELVVDVMVGLLLAGLGMLLGVLATGKGTVEVLREAGSAPKFPTVNLLLWLGCVASPVLGYVLFVKRGKSVGAWLRRRG